MSDAAMPALRRHHEGKPLRELRLPATQGAAPRRTARAGQERHAKAKKEAQPKEKRKPAVDLEGLLIKQITEAGLPPPRRQCTEPWRGTGRRFRGDVCYLDDRLIIEIDGGTWGGGRHTSGVGYRRDCVKRALAVIAGYRFINVTSDQVKDGTALEWITQLLGHAKEEEAPRKGRRRRQKDS